MTHPTVSITSKSQLDTLLGSSQIVVANFFSEQNGPSRQIAPIFQTLSESLSRPNVTFVMIDSDTNQDITNEYNINTLPTFVIFKLGKVIQKVQGANPLELRSIIEKLANEVSSIGEWSGAEVPRGYSDITDQVEIKGCELLNSDEDAGPVKVLFETSKPSVIEQGESTSKDWVQSGADDQLLLFIPFQSTIKLHTLQITSFPPEGQDEISRPEVIHLYINRTQNMSFGEAEDSEPTQAITLTESDWNERGTATISLRFVKFQKTSTITIFVQKGSDGADSVRIDRVKLIGEAGTKREMGKLQKISDDE